MSPFRLFTCSAPPVRYCSSMPRHPMEDLFDIIIRQNRHTHEMQRHLSDQMAALLKAQGGTTITPEELAALNAKAAELNTASDALAASLTPNPGVPNANPSAKAPAPAQADPNQAVQAPVTKPPAA